LIKDKNIGSIKPILNLDYLLKLVKDG